MYHSLIDAACNGNVYKKSPEEAFELLDNLVLSQTQAPYEYTEGGDSKKASAIAELTEQIAQLRTQIDLQRTKPAQVHAIQQSCEHCNGNHQNYECQQYPNFEKQEEVFVSSVDFREGMYKYSHPNPNYPNYS